MALAFHEPREQLPPEVINQHRAVESLIEELEAAIWYQQRASVSDNPELVSVLEHNRDEEIEHAAMLMEWLRRNFPGFDEQMRTYLFTDIPITEVEEMAEQAEQAGTTPETAEGKPAASDGSLNIGSLKKGK